jgi:hypothetical protein
MMIVWSDSALITHVEVIFYKTMSRGEGIEISMFYYYLLRQIDCLPC